MFSFPPAFIPSAFLHMFLLRATWSLMPAAPGWHGRLSSSYRVSPGVRGLREGQAGLGRGWAEGSLGRTLISLHRLPGTFCLHCIVFVRLLNTDKKNMGRIFAVILFFQRGIQVKKKKKQLFFLPSGFSFSPRSCLPEAGLKGEELSKKCVQKDQGKLASFKRNSLSSLLCENSIPVLLAFLDIVPCNLVLRSLQTYCELILPFHLT